MKKEEILYHPQPPQWGQLHRQMAEKGVEYFNE